MFFLLFLFVMPILFFFVLFAAIGILIKVAIIMLPVAAVGLIIWLVVRLIRRKLQ